MSKRLPRPPPPDFTGWRARLEDHDRAMDTSQRYYGTRCCPDCYLPPAQCKHLREKS